MLEHGWIWLEQVPRTHGFWLEVIAGDEDTIARLAPHAAQVVGLLAAGQNEVGRVTEELADRFQEIDLLYSISELLVQKLHFRETARNVLGEVSNCVGARRGSIMVYDEDSQELQVAASWGTGNRQLTGVRVDDPESIAAKVFRDERVLVINAEDAIPDLFRHEEERAYRGRAFLCTPVSYAMPGTRARCLGVMSFTDRLGNDEFTITHQKLVAAVANQVGAAIENDRLTILDLQQQRLQQELDLAHDLQLKLMPVPAALAGVADLAVRCVPAEQVGGDFYTFGRLREGQIGVMLGDVSSHGFSAALVMALVLSAAAIHTGTDGAPNEVLDALHASLSAKLDSTEMYLTVFYGILCPSRAELVFANAGHQHAFRIPRRGAAVRLQTTAPPLGLAAPGSIAGARTPWDLEADILCLWTDGLVEARNESGQTYGEPRLLGVLEQNRQGSPDSIAEAVFEDLERFGATFRDDRTLLVLRL